jgi:hypothetical protein
LGVIVEDVGYDTVEDSDAGLGRSVKVVRSHEMAQLTTLRVPTRTLGGELLAPTISAMKLAVIPMMAMSDMACIPRTTVKVAPRAP